MICIFQILVVLFLVIFLALGIAAEVIPSKFFDGQCQNSNNPTLALAYSTTDKADKSLCLTCQCNLKNSTIATYDLAEQLVLHALININ
jgi:hypothetical protein